jgi:rhamnosyltransferase
MSICAVVVSYRPAEEIIENAIALLDQVDEVVIVDNGSGADTNELLGRLGGYSGVRVVYNKENLGIAAALNIGIKYAKAAGHQWLATFDQDSKVTPDMIMTMLQVYDTVPSNEKIAGLSPRYQNQATGQIATSSEKYSSSDTLPYAEVLVVMTSGNLLKLSIFDAVGCFNEALFIDHVDTEFCLRCAMQGYKLLEVNKAILLHCIGFPVQHRILGKLKTTTNHSSLRRYYIARNSIYVYKKFAFTFPVWVARDAVKLLKLVVMLVMFETDRRKKLVAILKGIIHGMLGKMGKFNESS